MEVNLITVVQMRPWIAGPSGRCTSRLDHWKTQIPKSRASKYRRSPYPHLDNASHSSPLASASAPVTIFAMITSFSFIITPAPTTYPPPPRPSPVRQFASEKKKPPVLVAKAGSRGNTCPSLRATSNGTVRDTASEEEGEEDEAGVCPVDCVSEFKTDEKFKKILDKAKERGALVVVDFYRTSCGSCKYIEQIFKKMCKGAGDEEADVLFLKHNVVLY